MSDERIKTVLEAKMASRLLKAHDAKKAFGEAHCWFTHREAMLVLGSFKAGAARAFLEKLSNLGAFEFLKIWTGDLQHSVFRFSGPAEESLRRELREISDHF